MKENKDKLLEELQNTADYLIQKVIRELQKEQKDNPVPTTSKIRTCDKCGYRFFGEGEVCYTCLEGPENEDKPANQNNPHYTGKIKKCNFCNHYWYADKVQTTEVNGRDYDLCPQCILSVEARKEIKSIL